MLKSKLVVVTRDVAGNNQLAGLIKQKGARVYKLPTIKIVKVKPSKKTITALKQVEGYNFIIFTSVHAVEFFIKAVKKVKQPFIFAIGPATYEAAIKAGLKVSGTVKNLGKITNSKILLPCSAIAQQDLANKLRQKKALVTQAVLYTTLPIKKPDLKLNLSAVSCITFASPSAVLAFPGRLKNVILFKQALLIPAVCIGPTTARAAKKLGFKKVIIAKTQTAEGIANALP